MHVSVCVYAPPLDCIHTAKKCRVVPPFFKNLRLRGKAKISVTESLSLSLTVKILSWELLKGVFIFASSCVYVKRVGSRD